MPKKLPKSPQHTVSIAVFVDPNKPATLNVKRIPWFPGMTVLQAMIIADAMTDSAFSFRAVYASFYGAFIDKIIGTEDAGSSYWMLYVEGQSANVGASTQLIIENTKPTNVEIEWKYTNVPTSSNQTQIARKKKAFNFIEPT
jgi:hypothetical protein